MLRGSEMNLSDMVEPKLAAADTSAEKASTLTPQNAFPLTGSLEATDTIAAISLKILDHSKYGLAKVSQGVDDDWLCRHFSDRLNRQPETTRSEWARMKEFCLLFHGSPIAQCIDYLSSAMRTPAIAESAIRSAGDALYRANEEAGTAEESRVFFRSLMASVIQPPIEDELSRFGKEHRPNRDF